MTFDASDRSASFTIDTHQDTDSSDETVNLGFGALPSGVSGGSPSTATLTIQDDDTVPPITLPPAPTGVSKEVSDRTLKFTWTASTGATAYSGLLTLPGSGVNLSCGATAPATTCTFNSLINGANYTFKVRASKSGVDGPYSSPIPAMPVDPTVTLSGWEGSISAGDAPTFRVSISGLSKTRRYQLRLERENPGDAFGFVAGCATDFQNESIPSGSTGFSGGPYTMYGCSPTPLVAVGAATNVRAVVILADTGLQQRPCDIASSAGCEWRRLHYEEVEVTPSIDVEPRPLRRAKLTWQDVPSANGYTLEVREQGTAWPTPGTRSATRTTPVSSAEIELDRILATSPPKGLADAEAYEIRVRATGSSSYQDSSYSDEIMIIDTPIVEANGHSPGDGQAKLSWRAIGDVLGDPTYSGGTYSFRYRQEGGNHTQLTWRPGRYISNETVHESDLVNGHTIGGQNHSLVKEAVYERVP